MKQTMFEGALRGASALTSSIAHAGKVALVGVMVVAAAVPLASSCGSDDDNDSGGTETPSKATLTVSEDTIRLAAASDAKTFILTCDSAWVVNSNQDWATVSPTGGNATAAAGTTITISVTANTGSARTASLSATSGSVSKTVAVVQAGIDDEPDEPDEPAAFAWEVKDGVLTISGTCPMPMYDSYPSSKMAPWNSLKGSITSAVIKKGITSIGGYAFYGCRRITAVSIANSVTSIEESAFLNCDSLTSIILPNSVTSIAHQSLAFCQAMTAVTLSNALTSIGTYALSSSGLTSVTIPKSVTSIEQSAFSMCNKLSLVTVGWDNPSSVSLGENVFWSQSGKKILSVPSGTKALYEAAEQWKDFGIITDREVVASEVTGTAWTGGYVYGGTNVTLTLTFPTATTVQMNQQPSDYTYSGIYTYAQPTASMVFSGNAANGIAEGAVSGNQMTVTGLIAGEAIVFTKQ
jgi:hypothetical protein